MLTDAALKILAIEPFYGGSHRAFLDGLSRHSGHEFIQLTGPARHWKWRMRAAPFELAEELKTCKPAFDLLFASDFVDLPTLIGLTPALLTNCPKIIYFHENQFTYPVQQANERDFHYAVTNLLSMHAADEVWFNSEWHRQDFYRGAEAYLNRMPGKPKGPWLAGLLSKTRVEPLGLDLTPFTKAREQAPPKQGPLTILWNHRWEHDKAPEAFANALERLESTSQPYRLILCGQRFRKAPEAYQAIANRFRHRLVHDCFVSDQTAYAQLLAQADIVVSTAIHEFFGVSVVEAMAAGCKPLLPKRLSYPELLPLERHDEAFYLSETDLADRLVAFAQAPSHIRARPSLDMGPFGWPTRAQGFDQAFLRLFERYNQQA